MKKNTAKIFRFFIFLLLLLFLLSCSLEDKETEPTTPSSPTSTEPDWTNRLTEITLHDEEAYIINNKIALYKHLKIAWEYAGENARRSVIISPYGIFDLDPALDPTLYNGNTYQRKKEKLALFEIMAMQDILSGIAEQESEAFRAMESEKVALDNILKMQTEQKLQKVVEHLESIGINAEIVGHSIMAELSLTELLTLSNTDCIFFIVSLNREQHQ